MLNMGFKVLAAAFFHLRLLIKEEIKHTSLLTNLEIIVYITIKLGSQLTIRVENKVTSDGFQNQAPTG